LFTKTQAYLSSDRNKDAASDVGAGRGRQLRQFVVRAEASKKDKKKKPNIVGQKGM
jgi:hypothetical protein